MTNTQLPKQTIERIEREAYTYADENYSTCRECNHSLHGLEQGHAEGATREALLVLPIIEQAKKYREFFRHRFHTTDDTYHDMVKEFDAALTNYEQGTVK